VGFSVNDGEIVGLIGPNGAGKTTLFNLISGFHPPDQGKVIFAGEDITALRADQVARKRDRENLSGIYPVYAVNGFQQRVQRLLQAVPATGMESLFAYPKGKTGRTGHQEGGHGHP